MRGISKDTIRDAGSASYQQTSSPVDVPPARRVPGRAMPSCIAKRTFRFSKGLRIPMSWRLRAAELGCAALAVTDRNSLAGVVRAHAAAKQLGLKLIVGAEIHLLDAPPVLLWTTDRASYGRLARLITRGRRQAPKGEFQLSFDELAEHADGTAVRRAAAAECGSEHARKQRRAPLAGPLSRAVRRSRLPGGRAGQRTRRRGGAWPAGGSFRGARGCRWWRPATCTITARARLALQDTLTAIRLG